MLFSLSRPLTPAGVGLGRSTLYRENQARGGQDGDVGLLANGSLAFVEVPEVGRATDGNPGSLDEGQ
jgi:hypothetical protein